MDFDALLALGSARRWDEMKGALMRPENRVLFAGCVLQFEELGDRCVASGSFLDAIEYFVAALHCAMALLYAPSKGEDPAWLVAPYTRLCQKGPDARRRFEQCRADTPGAVDVRRKPEVLRPPEKVTLQAPDPQVILEALLGKLQGMASAGTSTWRDLLRGKESREFYPQIGERFEALGDEQRETGDSSAASEFYRVALHALDLIKYKLINSTENDRSERVAGKLWKIEESILEERIAHPVGTDFVRGPLTGSHGMDSVELLVLAGRFQEADRLMRKVARLDKSGPVHLNRLERTGDLLEQKHPELARWFFEKFRQYAADLPHDREYETRECAAVVGSAEEKLNRVKARLPKRRATILISLAGWGDPTPSCPAPQNTSQTMLNEGLLTLAPDWVFAHYREAGGRVLRPEQWPARYRFNVFMVGRRAQLNQIEDEYGRRQPFDLGSNAPVPDVYRAPPFRLNIGKPVTIYCRVAGGGPEWTLTLSGFDEVA